MRKKKWLAALLACAVAATMLPATAFAVDDTVENAKTFSFIGGETTQEDIDAAWGEGAVLYTSEVVEGETVCTIKLLKDIVMAAANDVRIGEYRENGPELPQMILDLNGYTITSQSIGLINWGDLIIRDTSEAQTGGITYSTTSDKSSLVAISHKGGLLVIEGGTFTCESGYAFTGYVAAVSTQSGAETHIMGGTFISNSSAVLSTGDTIVYGGTFEAPYGMYAKAQDGTAGTITVPEESTAVVDADKMAFVTQRVGDVDGIINVAGGSYQAPALVGKVSDADAVSAVHLTGGEYNQDPAQFAGTAPVAELVSEEGSQGFFIGKDINKKAAQQAAEGDQIVVKQGDVEIEGIPDKVQVKNEGTGSVSANGSSVGAGQTVEAHYYVNGVCTICGAIDPNYTPEEDDTPAITPSVPTITHSDGWEQNRNGEWVYYQNGRRVSGWIEDKGVSYYLDEDYTMVTGWQQLDGKWYYFYTWGGMAEGWVLDGDVWYYLDPDSGEMATGWKQLNGKWYYFYTWGGMAEGWAKVNNVWYYLDPASGEMQTGWELVNGKWYYLYSWGGMAYNTTVDGYVVGADGAWIQ